MKVDLVASKFAKNTGWNLSDEDGTVVLGQPAAAGYEAESTKPTLHSASTCISKSKCGSGNGGTGGTLTLSFTGAGSFDSHAIYVDGQPINAGQVHKGSVIIVDCSNDRSSLIQLTRKTMMKEAQLHSQSSPEASYDPPHGSSEISPDGVPSTNQKSDASNDINATLNDDFSIATRILYDEKDVTPSEKCRANSHLSLLKITSASLEYWEIRMKKWNDTNYEEFYISGGIEENSKEVCIDLSGCYKVWFDELSNVEFFIEGQKKYILNDDSWENSSVFLGLSCKITPTVHSENCPDDTQSTPLEITIHPPKITSVSSSAAKGDDDDGPDWLFTSEYFEFDGWELHDFYDMESWSGWNAQSKQVCININQCYIMKSDSSNVDFELSIDGMKQYTEFWNVDGMLLVGLGCMPTNTNELPSANCTGDDGFVPFEITLHPPSLGPVSSAVANEGQDWLFKSEEFSYSLWMDSDDIRTVSKGLLTEICIAINQCKMFNAEFENIGVEFSIKGLKKYTVTNTHINSKKFLVGLGCTSSTEEDQRPSSTCTGDAGNVPLEITFHPPKLANFSLVAVADDGEDWIFLSEYFHYNMNVMDMDGNELHGISKGFSEEVCINVNECYVIEIASYVEDDTTYIDDNFGFKFSMNEKKTYTLKQGHERYMEKHFFVGPGCTQINTGCFDDSKPSLLTVSSKDQSFSSSKIDNNHDDSEWMQAISSGKWEVLSAEGDIILQGSDDRNTRPIQSTCINPLECFSFVYYGDDEDEWLVQYVISVEGLEDQDISVSNHNVGQGNWIGQGCNKDFCKYKPSLSSDAYGQRIPRALSLLEDISGIEVLNDRDSPQYQAACWVLYEDPLRKKATDKSLVQRYILQVIFRSAGYHRDDSFSNLPHFECDWGRGAMSCEDGYTLRDAVSCDNEVISKLCIQDNRSLKGQIVSEIAQLSSLEYLALNNFEGHIPEELYSLSSLKKVHLEGNNFDGTLSTSIGSLMNMMELHMHNNNMKGSIPAEIGTCSSLESLRLANNQLTGPIPLAIMNLTSIGEIDLSNNFITGSIPKEIGHLTKLTKLHMERNELTGLVPSTLGNLSQLHECYLSNNKLAGSLSADLGRLTNLQSFILNENRFTGAIPQGFGDMSSLQILQIEGNQFTGTVYQSLCDHFETGKEYHFSSDCSIGAVPRLNCVCCTECHDHTASNTRRGKCRSADVTVKIKSITRWRDNPDDLTDGKLYKWKLLDGQGKTVMNGGPYEVSLDCPEQVDCERDYQSCLSISECYSLTITDIRGTEVSNYPPFEVIVNDQLFANETWIDSTYSNQCSSVNACGMDLPVGSPERAVYNALVKFSGEVLSEHPKGKTAELEAACWIIKNDTGIIDLSDEYFLLQRYVTTLLYYKTGGTNWFNQHNFLSHLHECEWFGIHCDENKFIRNINLTRNNLEGNIFHELGQLRFLEVLSFEGNSLHGSLPLELSNMWSLEKIYLGDNYIKGTIPSVIGDMGNLKVFDLHNNALFGHLPSQLFRLNMMEECNLAMNSLNGNIVPAIGNMESLEKLDLSGNFFTGSIPKELLEVLNLSELILFSNELDGKIPFPQRTSNLTNYLTRLSRLDLSSNKLGSTISTFIGDLDNLIELMLDDNRLTGTIPAQIGKLKNLERISLSYNGLQGKIPAQLGNLMKLSWVHLHGNDLSGNADVFQSAQVYITDCGRPSSARDPIVCDTCTICCNSKNECQQNYLNENPQNNALIASTIIFGFLIAASAILASTFKRRSVGLTRQDYRAVELCGEDSVYFFVLCRTKWGWSLFLGTIMAQIAIFLVFLRASSFKDKDNSDWAYSMRCPRNSYDCDDEKQIDWLGFTAFVILMVSFLLRDLVHGFRLVFMAIRTRSIRCGVGGTILVVVTSLAAFTSYYYNQAIALSNTDLVVNSVILLFVNEIDEQMYGVVRSIFPVWTDRKHKEAEEFEAIFCLEGIREQSNYSEGIVKDPEDDELNGIVRKLKEEVNGIKLELEKIQSLENMPELSFQHNETMRRSFKSAEETDEFSENC